MMVRGMSTCAAKELIGINEDFTAAGAIKALVNHTSVEMRQALQSNKKCPSNFGSAFVVVSYAYDKANGSKAPRGPRSFKQAYRIETFCDYIARNKLGTTVIAQDNSNPVHQGESILRSMIWTPDNVALWKFAKKMKYYTKVPPVSKITTPPQYARLW